jgi:hypothetical protein
MGSCQLVGDLPSASGDNRLSYHHELRIVWIFRFTPTSRLNRQRRGVFADCVFGLIGGAVGQFGVDFQEDGQGRVGAIVRRLMISSAIWTRCTLDVLGLN